MTAPQQTAMLFALTSPHPSLSFDDFNKWYDERHAPARAVCSGVNRVCRFHVVDKGTGSTRVSDWTWLATYELDSEDALKTEEYKNARKADGDDESKMFDFLSRRVYKLLEDKRRNDYRDFASSGKSRLLTVIGLHPSSTSEEKSIEQYAQKQLEDAAADKGWLRSSFWQLSTAADPRTWQEQLDVPKLMVLHEWEETPASLEGSALQQINGSSVGQSEHEQMREKALLRLWKQF